MALFRLCTLFFVIVLGDFSDTDLAFMMALTQVDNFHKRDRRFDDDTCDQCFALFDALGNLNLALTGKE